MSKSLGNLVFVGDLLKEWEPAAIRLALLSHHYRRDWEWSHQDLEVAAARLGAWRATPGALAVGGPGPDDTVEQLGSDEDGLWRVRAYLDDDLDTPGALAALDDEASLGRAVVQGAALLGISL
jgi:L-cysteine:1D-myo-inositol 2-amino-2-deoxy-alpha-D-glucopyranoside ligase